MLYFLVNRKEGWLMIARFVGANSIVYEGERSSKKLLMPSLKESVVVPVTPYIGLTHMDNIQVGINIGDWQNCPLDHYDMEHSDLFVAFAVTQLLGELWALPEGVCYKAYEVVRLGTDEKQRQFIRENSEHLIPIMEAVSLERLREISRQVPPDLDKAVKYLADHQVRFATKPIIKLVAEGKLNLDYETIGKIAVRSARFP